MISYKVYNCLTDKYGRVHFWLGQAKKLGNDGADLIPISILHTIECYEKMLLMGRSRADEREQS